MKEISLFLLAALLFSATSFAQHLRFPSGKIYLKNGTVQEGAITINTNEERPADIAIKSKKYLKEEVTVKVKGEKKEKISADLIDKIEVYVFVKLFGKETKKVTYRPVQIDKDALIARELVQDKLYAVLKPKAFSMSSGAAAPGTESEYDKYWVYYINKEGKYESTTLAQLKQDNNCDMKGEGNREEKIAHCLESQTN
ncbi:MAG: hypothetical protein LBE82_02405 [Chitinophagaceae bacterium]|nr:hypothetical protein [Chitinophagaceae bacterium]